MRKLIFILSLLFSIALLPHVGNALRPPRSRAEQEKLNTAFLSEVASASPAHIKELLAAGAEIDCANEEGETVLMRAARSDQLKTVKALIGLHARVNARDKSGRTALFYAFMGNGQYNPTPQMIEVLLDAGAEINAVSKYGETPLKMALTLQSQSALSLQQSMRAAEAGHYYIGEILQRTLTTDKAALVALLKQRGARAGLAEAAFSGDSDTIQSLLRNGADIHSSAVTSALETAIRIEDPGVVKLLLAAGADPNARDREGMSLLMQAVGEGRLPIVQAILDGGAKITPQDSYRVLMLVNGQSQDAILKLLLDRGAKIDARGPHGRTMLMAVARGYSEWVPRGGNTYRPAKRPPTGFIRVASNGLGFGEGDYIIGRSPEEEDATLKTLIDRGADVNARDKDGLTALMLAAEEDSDRVVKTLNACGADVNRRDNWGATALAWVAGTPAPQMPENWQGADMEEQHRAIIRDLRKAGAHIDLAEALLLDDFPTVRAMLAAGCDTTGRGPNGESLLMIAAKKGQNDIVQDLLDRGGDVNTHDRYKTTPLMIAAERGHTETIQLLLAHGAEVNARDFEGRTALMLAIRGQYPQGTHAWSGLLNQEARTEIVKELLAHHANLHVTTDEIRHLPPEFRIRAHEDTALSLAHLVDNLPAIQALIRYGAKEPPSKMPTKVSP
jgi:ankyrin repeat protein